MSAQPASPAAASLPTRVRSALTPPERRRAAGMTAAIVALHAIGFFILLVAFATCSAFPGGEGRRSLRRTHPRCRDAGRRS